MDDTENTEPPQAPPEVIPDADNAPLPPGRVRAALWLGLGSMVLYCLALQLGIMGLALHGDQRSQLGYPIKFDVAPPLMAGIACVGFLSAVMLIWRVQLLRLMMLTGFCGLLVGVAVLATQRGIR